MKWSLGLLAVSRVVVLPHRYLPTTLISASNRSGHRPQLLIDRFVQALIVGLNSLEPRSHAVYRARAGRIAGPDGLLKFAKLSKIELQASELLGQAIGGEDGDYAASNACVHVEKSLGGARE